MHPNSLHLSFFFFLFWDFLFIRSMPAVSNVGDIVDSTPRSLQVITCFTLCGCSSSGRWRWSAPSRMCWTARRGCRPSLPRRPGRWSSGAARGATRHRTWSRSTRTMTSPSRTSWRRSTTSPVSPVFRRRFHRRSLVFLGNPKWINIFVWVKDCSSSRVRGRTVRSLRITQDNVFY